MRASAASKFWQQRRAPIPSQITLVGTISRKPFEAAATKIGSREAARRRIHQNRIDDRVRLTARPSVSRRGREQRERAAR